MGEIPEALLQELWRNLPRLSLELYTTDGREVRIHSPGVHNRDAGPDFLNAAVSLGDIRWAGDVEVHARASDWYRHHHEQDAAYDSVILHVVGHYDGDVALRNGAGVPTLELPRIPRLLELYSALVEQVGRPPCGETLAGLAPIARDGWFARLLVERLAARADEVIREVGQCELGWEEAFYRSAARSLGQKVNADAMGRLAELTPLKVLLKLRDAPGVVEAILVGQSGLLPSEEAMREDPYASGLYHDWAFHSKKNGLRGMGAREWRFLRMRPSSFPSVRVAQLAALISQRDHLFSRAMQAQTVDELRDLFAIVASPYWDTHYRLGEVSRRSVPKRLGEERVRLLIINTVVPYRFAYAQSQGDARLQESTIALLEGLSAEDNVVLRDFAASGVVARDAMESQALLQLHKAYCVPRVCFLCPAGREYLLLRGYRAVLREGDSPSYRL